MSPDDLDGVNSLAIERGADILPTIFLRREYLATFREVLEKWSSDQKFGRLKNILGFGVEGPLLGTSGGVPDAGCWWPDAATWRAIAQLGDIGLRYIVIAPDALALDETLDEDLTFKDLIDLFYAHGVRLALGHFRHDNPQRSATRTCDVIDYVNELMRGQKESIVTDHLYNDMPRSFTHAWRTEEELAHRDSYLQEFLQHPWKPDSIHHLLGPVPAAIMDAARSGKILPMLNFDGAHVDLEICRRTVDYLGADRIIAITDHTEINDMAGEALERAKTTSLLIRPDGRVAAGTTDLSSQIDLMRGIGLDESQINDLISNVPRRAISPLTPPSALATSDPQEAAGS